MSRVGFEPTIPALERVKTDHALDRAATAIGRYLPYVRLISLSIYPEQFITQKSVNNKSTYM
jgi:hypothetical protein